MKSLLISWYLRAVYHKTKAKENNGFTLLELLTVVIIVGVLAAIAAPNFFRQLEKVRSTEAIKYLGVLNRTQQAYYFERAAFASNMTDLGTELNLGSNLYNYSISGPITNTEAHHMAIPQPQYINDTRIITSAIYRVNDGFRSVVCQGNAPGVTPIIIDFNTCNNGEIVGK